MCLMIAARRSANQIVYSQENSIEYIDNSDIDSNYEIDFNNDLVTNSTQVEDTGVSGTMANSFGPMSMEVDNPPEESGVPHIELSRVSQQILFQKYFRIVTSQGDNVMAVCQLCPQKKYLRGSLKTTSHFSRHLRVSLKFERVTNSIFIELFVCLIDCWTGNASERTSDLQVRATGGKMWTN